MLTLLESWFGGGGGGGAIAGLGCAAQTRSQLGKFRPLDGIGGLDGGGVDVFGSNSIADDSAMEA